MVTRKTSYFQLFITAIVIVSFLMPMVHQAPEAAADGSDDLKQINLFLKHEGNTDYYMNSVRENPGDTTGVTEIIWDYGWWDGDDVVEGELLNDLYIEGTFSGGEEVYIEVSVTYASISGSTDVTMQLRDNGEVIAEVTDSLSGGFPSGEENSVWRLPFTAAADGTDHHTFLEGHTMSVRMFTDGGNVNVDYRGGDAHVEFNANQLDQEEFWVFDVNGNDMFGQEFAPKYPEESGLGTAHLWGTFLDTFTHRDIDVIRITIEGPEKTIEPDPISPQIKASGLVAFHFNWTYGDDVTNEADAGTYYVTFDIVDQSGNNFTFVEEVRFIMSKYGVYLTLEEGESADKKAGPGEYVHFNIVVHNAGLVDNDVFDLTHGDLAGDWEAVIEPTSVTLNSEQFETILLNISIPEDKPVGDSLDLKITAISQKSDEDAEYGVAKWDLRTTTRVAATARISVFFREQDSDDDNSEFMDIHGKKGNAEKGVDRDFNFRVKNDSPSDDEITLYLDNIPNDWDASIIDPDTEEDVDNVTLIGNDEVLLLVRVRPATAQGANNRANLEITGVSGNNQSVFDTAYLNVTRTLGVVVSTNEEDKLQLLKPDLRNTIDFIIDNTGNEDRTFTIDINLDTLDRDEWDVDLTGDPSIEVASGDGEIFSLDITPTENAINKEDGYYFVITAEDEDDSDVRYEFTVEMNVETQYKLELEITVRERTIEEAGDSVEYIVLVKNAGNSEVTITLEVVKDKTDWDASLDKTADTFVPGATQKEFILTVSAPDPVDNKETCTVTVTATVLGHTDTAKSVTTKTEVKKGDVDKFVDTLQEYSWMLAIFMVFIIVAIVLYYHSQQYDEYDEDDEEYDEDYEEDDWE